MSRMNQFLQSGKFLKASDLQGKPHPVTIESVRWERLQDDKDEQPIISFVGKPKELVCNKTNGLTLTEALGEDETKWAGKRIELYPTRTQFAGKLVDCVRIRIDGAMQSSDLPAQDDVEVTGDEIPF